MYFQGHMNIDIYLNEHWYFVYGYFLYVTRVAQLNATARQQKLSPPPTTRHNGFFLYVARAPKLIVTARPNK